MEPTQIKQKEEQIWKIRIVIERIEVAGGIETTENREDLGYTAWIK